ncbi:glycosyltransferase family protein [Aeromicrobium sp. P5_D10]
MSTTSVSEDTPTVAVVTVSAATYQVVVPDPGADEIQRHLLTTGTPYGSDLLTAVSALLGPDDLVLDVGASIGNHTLFWASVVGCSVVAFESDSRLAAALELSVERNDLGGRVAVRQFIPTEANPEDFEVRRLNAESFDRPVALIKIDVDGAEGDVLRGVGELIGRDRPILCVEVRDLDGFDAVSAWMLEHDYGYRTTYDTTSAHLFVPSAEQEREANEVVVGLVRAAYLARDEMAALRQTIALRADPASLSVSQGQESRELNNARMAYEKVHSEALQYRSERDARVTEIARLREQLQRSRAQLKRERGQTAKLAKQAQLLSRHPALRASRLAKRVLRRPARILRRLMPRRPTVSTPTAKVITPPREVRTSPLSEFRLLDPETLAVRETQAQRSSAALASIVASGEPLRIATVVDEFTRQALAEDCTLLNLNSNTWREQLEMFAPHLLFVESAWRGDQGSWHNTVPRLDENMRGILEYCRERSIPTVFWNKEDPVHFETFLRVAAEFDQVFTTDVDRVGAYMSRIGHSRVGLLAFACQPTIHNPVETVDRQEALVFAGGYYQRYPERMADLRALVNGISSALPIEIFDRNLGTTLEAYSFPDEYRQYIVGTLAPKDIDIAYKGYRYALNLNSVKSSQSMFARRAYELLASNTMTISNYARGIKVMLGELIPMSDSEDQIRHLVEGLVSDPDRTDKIRAMGLRKVLGEHTYAHRLATVVTTLTGVRPDQKVPAVTVLTKVSSVVEAKRAQERAEAQSGVDATLVLVTDDEETRRWATANSVAVYAEYDLAGLTLADVASGEDVGIACLHQDDWYGEHYLEDLTSAWKYSSAQVVGKSDHYEAADGAVRHVDGVQYRAASDLRLRSAVVSRDAAQLVPTSVVAQDTRLPEQLSGLAVHRFDYCLNAVAQGVDVAKSLSAWLPLDTGVAVDKIERQVAEMKVDPSTDRTPMVRLESYPSKPHVKTRKSVQITLNERDIVIKSTVSPGAVRRVWSTDRIDVRSIWPDGVARFGFVKTGDLILNLLLRFVDSDGKTLGSKFGGPDVEQEIEIPEGAAWAFLGWKIKGPGRAKVASLALGPSHFGLPPQLGGENIVLITDHYPAYDELYRNAFVHARVRKYLEAGLKLDVFRPQRGIGVQHREFEGVEVTAGSAAALRELLETQHHRAVVVHFLNQRVWEALQHCSQDTRILIWVHGAEVQAWWRRKFNYQTEEALAAAQVDSDARIAFWRTVIDSSGPNVHFVFVSSHFAAEVQQDLERSLRPEQYTVLHNPIDTDIFQFHPKDPAQRHEILSLRPYASRIYANDLAVAAVLELSNQPWFDQLSFRFVGDGELFEETLAPLRGMANVTIQRGYLTHRQIAALYRDYGVMLIPSRSETHGVSRDEAMASGLVPVASDVAAVPEFVSEVEGFLAPFDDHHGLAAAIATLHDDPEGFLRRSAAAAARVRRQAGADVIIPQEINVILGQ